MSLPYYESELNRIASEYCHRLLYYDHKSPNWHDALGYLSAAFPGSFSAFLIQRYDVNLCDPFMIGEIDAANVNSYAQHYSQVNPWLSVWNDTPPGKVFVSERHSPSRLLRGSEFYEDWLLPLGNGEAAVGLKIASNDDHLVHLPIHYPISCAPIYDDAISLVMDEIKSTILMCARLERLTAEAFQAGTVAELIYDSDLAVFIIKPDLSIEQMNKPAASLLAERSIITPTSALGFLIPEMENWLRRTVSAANRSLHRIRWDEVFQVGEQAWRIELFPVPRDTWSGVYPPPRRYALSLRNLKTLRSIIDFPAFARDFQLTDAEMQLCAHLAEGLSLSAMARQLGIAEGTARTRLKTIFHKTDTHRQAELISLLFRSQRQ